MEATTGFEPVIKALQASALPLGHVAIFKKSRLMKGRLGVENGADDGVRTRDPNLGKVVLYQLSHVRAQKGIIVTHTWLGKLFFEILPIDSHG